MAPEEVATDELDVLTGRKPSEAAETPPEAASTAAEAPTPEPEAASAPEEPPDNRQQWVCVDSKGARTVKDGAPCPPFRSDSHIAGVPVRCPNCGGMSAQKVEAGTPAPVA